MLPLNLFHARSRPGLGAARPAVRGGRAKAQMAPLRRDHLAVQIRYYEAAFVLGVLVVVMCLTTTFLPLS